MSPETQSAAELPQVIREGGVTYTLNTFEEGKCEGFKFYSKEFDSFEALQAAYSPAIITTIVNRQVMFALRQKATASIANDEDAKAKALRTGGEALLVVDVATAKAYVPGERDLTSISGCEKKIRELVSEVKELRTQQQTNPEDASTIETRIDGMKLNIMELRKKMQDLIAKSEDVENL